MVSHEVVPGIVSPEVCVAQILPAHVAEKPGGSGRRVMGLGFAGAGNDQTLRSEVGCAIRKLFDGRGGKSIRFPCPGSLFIKPEMFFRRLPVFGAQGLRVETEVEIDERNAEFRMVCRAMIALAVVFHRQLPVAILDDVGLMCDLRISDVIGARRSAIVRSRRSMSSGGLSERQT